MHLGKEVGKCSHDRDLPVAYKLLPRVVVSVKPEGENLGKLLGKMGLSVLKPADLNWTRVAATACRCIYRCFHSTSHQAGDAMWRVLAAGASCNRTFGAKGSFTIYSTQRLLC